MGQPLEVTDYPLMRFTLPEKLLRRVGLRAAVMIVDRTQSGKDADGKPFAPYSTRPFAMPAGATTKSARVKLARDGQLRYFRKPSGALWVVVEGGYAALKRARYGQDGGRVNLTASGAMLRALRPLRVTRTTSGGEVVVGFSRDEMAARAGYVEAQGRKFVGLSSDEIASLSAIIEANVRVALE